MTSSDASLGTADYDELAAVYAEANDNGLFNAWYGRPEMLRLGGDVAGMRVLDAGCGHGPLAAALHDRGATVSGFDLSPALVALAEERLDAEIDLRVADLAAPLPYGDDEFDLVMCSLALHYVKDWAPTLAEMRRVLKPGGRLIVSIIHPFVYAFCYQDADYFALTQYSEDYDFDGTTFVMTYWHRPLQDVLNAFVDAGLVITTVTEPSALPDTPVELLPPEGRRFLCFLFFSLESP
ncbi:class I SAM-dependent methyltransferase [Luteipulveratus flavus]|uniref:Class I SAM-dependent methyltransferase n=1 Tax=Luteipulveratus flavus TaxID=3031728 RepID=A0ABT6CAN0_9MICO|nr:class I SAM-dependent methyltransferase [Luteipulveratus sp. YIM 133296]MDF8265942.1 class I SAM-dependent methyltransferase [Luteipulveratus sp. YIM 133296]